MRYWLFNSSTDGHIVDTTHRPGGFTLCHKPVNREEPGQMDLEQILKVASCTFCCDSARSGSNVARPRPY